MYYLLGKHPLGYFEKANIIILNSVKPYYDWRIKWYYKDGGIKKDWFFGMEDQPIKSIEFEQNKKLLGNGSITFLKNDFLIHSNDIVEIYQNSTMVYKGIVDSNIDTKAGKIKLIPIQQQLDERLVYYSFNTQTIKEMLQIIIDDLEDCSIYWDDDFIETGETTLYSTISFNYVTAKKAIDDLTKKLNNYQYGVNVNNKFVIYKNSTDILNKIIFNAEDKWYSEMEVSTNDDKIKATRYEVFIKSTESDSIRVGNVGYDIKGNPYETLDIEKVKRRKDTKFDISAIVSTSYALDFAYQELVNQSKLGQTIKLKNFRIDKYDPQISDYIKCIDDYTKILKPLTNSQEISIIEDSVNWTNVTNYTDDYVEGTNSLQFLGSNPSNSAGYYDFQEIKRYSYGIEKLLFMVKTDQEVGECLEFGLSNNTSSLFSNPYSIYISQSDFWEMKTINPTETEFRYLGVRLKNYRDNRRQFHWLGRNMLGAYAQPALFTLFWVDDIKIFAWDRSFYYGNVVQKKYKIDKKGFNCDITLNDYEIQDSQELFDLRKEVEKIKEIQTATT